MCNVISYSLKQKNETKKLTMQSQQLSSTERQPLTVNNKSQLRVLLQHVASVSTQPCFNLLSFSLSFLSQPSHLTLERQHAWKVRSSHVALEFCGCVSSRSSRSRSITRQTAGEHFLFYTGTNSYHILHDGSCWNSVYDTLQNKEKKTHQHASF